MHEGPLRSIRGHAVGSRSVTRSKKEDRSRIESRVEGSTVDATSAGDKETSQVAVVIAV
jgi:hypothetical protein